MELVTARNLHEILATCHQRFLDARDQIAIPGNGLEALRPTDRIPLVIAQN